MLRFFRKIRQRFFINRKFGQYVLYATGEIVLIVIGIMIALQLDNYNEERKRTAELFANLRELKSELESNISKAHGILVFYNNRDSLIRQHLCNTISREDITSAGDLGRQWALITSSFIAPFDRVALDKVNSDLEDLPEELESFKNALRFFDAKYEEIEKDYEGYGEISKGEEKYRAEKLSWYREMWRWDRPFDQDTYSKVLDYLFDDPHYQNQLYTYWNFLNMALVDDILTLRQESIFWVEYISNYLNQSKNTSYQLPEEWRFDLSGLLGTYQVSERVGDEGKDIRDMGKYVLFEDNGRLLSYTRFDPAQRKNFQSDQKVEWVVLNSKTVISPSGWFMHLVQRDSSPAALEYAGCNNRNLYFHKVSD